VDECLYCLSYAGTEIRNIELEIEVLPWELSSTLSYPLLVERGIPPYLGFIAKATIVQPLAPGSESVPITFSPPWGLDVMIMKISNQSSTRMISELEPIVRSTKSLRPSTHAVKAENRSYSHKRPCIQLRKTHEAGCKSLGVGDASGLHKLGYLNIYIMDVRMLGGDSAVLSRRTVSCMPHPRNKRARHT